MKVKMFIDELSTWGAFTNEEIKAAETLPWEGGIVDLFDAYCDGAYDEDIYILIDEIKYYIKRFA